MYNKISLSTGQSYWISPEEVSILNQAIDSSVKFIHSERYNLTFSVDTIQWYGIPMYMQLPEVSQATEFREGVYLYAKVGEKWIKYDGRWKSINSLDVEYIEKAINLDTLIGK